MNIDGFLNYFDEIPDPRIEQTEKHLLEEIITIAVLSFICGAETWEDIEDFGESNKSWLEKHLKLPHSIPSHGTFARLFARLNPEVFQECFLKLMQSWMKESAGELIAIDGKKITQKPLSKAGKRAFTFSQCLGREESYQLRTSKNKG